MLVGGHGAGVNVNIRVQLLDRDTDPPAFENASNGCGRDPFAYRTDNPSGAKDVLCHCSILGFMFIIRELLLFQKKSGGEIISPHRLVV
jgi:hypothetical protein